MSSSSESGKLNLNNRTYAIPHGKFIYEERSYT